MNSSNFIKSMNTHKKLIGMVIILIVYIIFVSILFTHSTSNIINNYSILSIVCSLFGAFLIIMIIFFVKKKDTNTSTIIESSPTLLNYIIKIISSILIFGVIIGVIIGIIYFMKNTPAIANATIYVLNFLIIGIFILFILKSFYVIIFKNTEPSKMSSTFFRLLGFINKSINRIIYEYNITTRWAVVFLLIEIFLIFLRIVLPKFLNSIIEHDSFILLKDSVLLNNETTLELYPKISKNITHTYNYGISFWINIDPQPPSTNVSYSENTNVLSYGGKPDILFNAVKNKIIFNITNNSNNNDTIFHSSDIPYQKWVNIIINYQGGTLDIFMDNHIVSSTPNIIPYMQYDNIVIGKNKGIYGHIKNVVYFNHYLTRHKISWLYNYYKMK